MNNRERLAATLAGAPVDRVPFAFWRHFHEIDRDPKAQAEASASFWRRFQPDFVKTMPNGCFCVEDWDCEINFGQEPAEVTRPAIASLADWQRLTVNSPFEGALGRELTAFRLLRELLPADVPILATAFSPLTVASKLAGARLVDDLRNHPAAVHSGLEVIAETGRQFTAALMAAGADGVYFATQMATTSLLTIPEYREFGRPYDLAVLEAARPGWINAIHIHGTDVMFPLLGDYPVHVLNWHVWESAPTLTEALALTPAVLMGGLQRWDLHGGTAAEIERQVSAVMAETGGRRLILTPGCVVRLGYNEANLDLVRRLIGAA